MTILTGWLQRFTILNADAPKSPWGNGNTGGNTGGNAGGSGGNSGGDGPRNPWAVPPGATRGGAKPTALDEFLRRARGGGGGGNGGGGFSGIPGAPNARSLWAIGVGLILAVWIVFTSFHQIGPQQRGVVTFFGAYSGTLEPGIRLTLPAPFNAVTKVDVQQINTDDFPAGTGGTGENLILTSDQNIIDLAYSVRWQITNAQDYAFQIANPRETVRATAESAMRAAIATTSLDDAIGSGRGVVETRVQQMMQEVLDSYNAGVRIQGVSIKQSQAPEAVIDDFKAVSAAQQAAVGNVNAARGYAQQTLAYAQGEATSFDKVYEQYRLAPEVTRRRMYYETMEGVLAKSDKTIIEAPGVVPYLPLPGGATRRLPDAVPEATPAPARQPAPAAGAVQ